MALRCLNDQLIGASCDVQTLNIQNYFRYILYCVKVHCLQPSNHLLVKVNSSYKLKVIHSCCIHIRVGAAIESCSLIRIILRVVSQAA